MGMTSIKGKLAAAFTAALMAVTPAYAATISPENTPNPHITTTEFEAGQCYDQGDIERYLTQTGETQIMEMDKDATVNMRVNTPFGPQVRPRTFDDHYTLMADNDSWTILAEGANNQSCIVIQGTDLDYVSTGNQYFTQVSDDIAINVTDRERSLERFQERFGETPFLQGTANDGRIVDFTTSLRGSWTVATSNADGSGFAGLIDGFTYSISGPEFHDSFGIFHPDSTNASDIIADVQPNLIDESPQL